MTALDRILPKPALVEYHNVDVAANPARVWQYVRHLELARSPIVRILFALRTLPDPSSGAEDLGHASRSNCASPRRTEDHGGSSSATSA